MGQFVLCNRTFYPDTLKSQCGLNITDLADHRCTPPKRIDAYTPYLVSGSENPNSQRIQTMLTRPQAKKIVEFSNAYGSDNVLALSVLFNKLSENLADDRSTAVMGSSTEFYTKRVDRLSDAVKQYQNSLLVYRDAVKSKSPDVKLAKQNAANSWWEMQKGFQTELSQIKSNAGSRGTPLNSLERGLNIARDSRNVTRLNLATSLQTTRLLQFTGYAKFLGEGVAVIDFVSRGAKIYSTYSEGGNWHKEMFVESLSFAVSTGVGMGMVTGGLTLLLAFTPIGWVGLIVAGVAIAGAAAYSSYKTNEALKNNGGVLYDAIMNSSIIR